MEIYNLLHTFWKLRQDKKITNLQADLYQLLIYECNVRKWKNPFECSNKYISFKLDISEQSLIDARNRLKQLGLIDFTPGIRNMRGPIYFIFYSNKWGRNRGASLDETIVATTVEPIVATTNEAMQPDGMNTPPFKKQKQKQNKKENKKGSASAEAGARENIFSKSEGVKERKKSPAAKKKESPPVPHWKVLTDCWASFYQERYNEKPTFNGAAVKGLKFIAGRLEQMATAKGHEWNEEYAGYVFHHFLIKAYADSWRQRNFMLHILAAHFDAIIQHDENNTQYNNRNSRAGYYNDTAAIFAAIDAMPD